MADAGSALAADERTGNGKVGKRILHRHGLRRLFELPVLVLAWLFAYPLGRFFPRDPRLVTIIGRDGGQFSDNAKYFYIGGRTGFAPGKYRVRFLTGEPEICALLRSHGAPVELYPSFRAFYLLLRTGAVVADSAEWVRFGRCQLANAARKVQLWHGVPLKSIERVVLVGRLQALGPIRRMLYRFYTRAFCRYPFYDAVVSTSAAMTRAAFGKSFNAGQIMESGYPRNDVMDPELRARLGPLVWLNTDDRVMDVVRKFKEQGIRIVLYAPTFRTSGTNPVDGNVLCYSALDEFAQSRGLAIIIKLHPVLAGGAKITGLERVVEYDPTCDVYPMLEHVDVLVTDYSSIYFDFLLLDRPVVFFPYDYEDYVQGERSLVFDYEQVTPGPRALTQDELQRQIADALNGAADTCESQRAAVRAMAFGDRPTGAVGRTWLMLDRLLDGDAVDVLPE